MGDGSLDPARLRERYTVDAGPWLRMVGDLLAQVVGDSGSLEQASVVLAVPLRTVGGMGVVVGFWRVQCPGVVDTALGGSNSGEEPDLR
jgi:hypothetical protein